jgi:hypothetical protein
MMFGNLALTSAALFTGAAFYINIAEHPARTILSDSAFLTQWKPSYSRGLVMQSSLAIIGFLLGTAAWWIEGRVLFLVGALLMIANWPWTLLGILPVNRVLMATEPAVAGPETRTLLAKWNLLHAVRTALGTLATVCFLAALTANSN